MTDAAVIECTDVSRVYPGGVRALDRVSLAVRPGDFLAVVGPSGSGKSTLLQLMGALDRPTGGEVRVAGTELGRLSDGALSRLRGETIGFVFQQFHLSPLMSVCDNVAEGLLYSGVRHRERRLLAVDKLTRLGLGHRLRHRPDALSGGERQRVAIARALVGDPAVILADEPTGNLDTANGDTVIEILRGLAAGGTAVVVVTHDREVAAGMDRVIEVRDGRIVDVPDRVTG
ncbi:ABC transporter ATP-binding protein [Nocardioides marmoriginsengisoli]|uniref:ABC transporter ATP-binding protein n=1 Tax=Nocardioides marmoriginsengisoli TaxID=661483 RepID=A0A3N0CNA1_9ACTN|nr:ABC transporter ATP-binding protein [Nocardioides marmoriginsengisoli]RNL64947.1 ABC transporter ATP-binding protein [Nocardioides marmoriginsengisoli]